MIVEISSGAEADVADGYWFYERQSIGLGDYFRSCIFADIESLRYFGEFMKWNMDSIDLCRNDFLLASITPWPAIVLRSWPFSIFDANRSGYENRSTTAGSQNKKIHASCGSGVLTCVEITPRTR